MGEKSKWAQGPVPSGGERSRIQEKVTPMGANEVGKYQVLRNILRGTDEDLRRITEDMLPKEMLKLKGIKQNPVHDGMDPLQHTFMMLSELDTGGAKYPELVRVASVFHDMGKMSGAEQGSDFFGHPKRSAEMVQPFLEKMGYAPWEIEVIRQLIRSHDLLGRRAQREEDSERRLVTFPDAKKELEPPEAAKDRLTREDMLDMHYRIIVADIRSIPGLADYEPDIHREYKELRESL